MDSSFGGIQHFNYSGVAATLQRATVTEKNFVVAQAVGGHDAIDKAPGGVGNFFVDIDNLLVGWQRPELGFAAAVTLSDPQNVTKT